MESSGLKKGYSGPSLHGSIGPDQNGIAAKGDFIYLGRPPTLCKKHEFF